MDASLCKESQLCGAMRTGSRRTALLAFAAMQESKQTQAAIGVCLGPRCGDYGGRALLDELRSAGIDPVVLECQSLCNFSPVVRLSDRCLLRATLEDVLREKPVSSLSFG